jgi:hypothetical protein
LKASVGLSEDGALSNNEYLPSRILFLELANDTLVDLVERFEEFERYVKDDCLTSSGAVNLLCCCDVKITERGLEVRGHLEVEKFLCDRSLKLIGLSLL